MMTLRAAMMTTAGRIRLMNMRTCLPGALIALAALGLGAGAIAPAADGAVYWTNAANDTIGQANQDGSGVNQAVISDANAPAGIVADSGHLYWANLGTDTIGRSGLDGSDPIEGYIAGATSTGIAVDGAHVYWSDHANATVARANLDGSAPNHSFIAGASAPEGIAVDGAHVYWANNTANTIGRANLDGSAPKQSFIAGASGPEGIAVDGAHVYWVNGSTGTIGRANLDGSAPNQAFIPAAAGVAAVAVDGAYVYWANSTANTIGRAKLDGSAGNPGFITGASDPSGVAVDRLRLAPGAGASDPPPASTPGAGVLGAAVQAEPAAPIRPALTGLRVSPRSFCTRHRRPAAAKPRRVSLAARPGRCRRPGATVSYRDSQPAQTTLSVWLAQRGEMRDRRCEPRPRRRANPGKSRRCVRWMKVGSLVHADRSGLNRVRLSGRLARRLLGAGAYRLDAVASNRSGATSASLSARFHITG
jgi:sugar lactone lactonase YvrE